MTRAELSLVGIAAVWGLMAAIVGVELVPRLRRPVSIIDRVTADDQGRPHLRYTVRELKIRQKVTIHWKW